MAKMQLLYTPYEYDRYQKNICLCRLDFTIEFIRAHFHRGNKFQTQLKYSPLLYSN